MKSSAPEPDLTFAWPRRERFSFALFGCFLASIAVHLLTFFLFQVVDPKRISIQASAHPVSFLAPTSPENIALLRWIEAEDPALIASATDIAPPHLASARYTPSFATARTALQTGDAETSEAVTFPPVKTALEIINSGQRPAPETPAAGAVATSFSFSPTLAGRALPEKAPPEFSVHASQPVQPALVLVGVNDFGEARYTFLQRSSGDAQLDAWALTHLHALPFRRGDAPLTWGFVSIVWGDDAYALSPARP